LDTYEKPTARTRAISHTPAAQMVKGNGNGSTNADALIPMEENRVVEHSEYMKDF